MVVQRIEVKDGEQNYLRAFLSQERNANTNYRIPKINEL